MSAKELESFKVELRRGTQILIVLSQLKDKEYGYLLLEKLVDKSVNIEAGTLYPLLRRLESQGLLESEWDTSDSRPRKYYSISNKGQEVLEILIKEWEEINEEVSEILRGI